MALEWQIEEQPEHLLVRVEGQWQTKRVLELLDEVSVACRQRGYLSVLIDCRDVTGHLSEADRYLAGTRVAQKLGKIRIAALLGKDAAMTKFAERVAAGRGASLLVTKDPEEAQRWLIDEADSPPTHPSQFNDELIRERQ